METAETVNRIVPVVTPRHFECGIANTADGNGDSLNVGDDTLVELNDTENVLHAAQVYILRRDRKDHPDGSFDKAGRWYPSSDEYCHRCYGIREPSRAWPYTLMIHCRTAQHVAEMMGVDVKGLRAAAKKLDAALYAYVKGEEVA